MSLIYPAEWSTLKWPWRRSELFYVLKDLACASEAELRARPGTFNPFDPITGGFEFLYEDVLDDMAEDPASMLGYVLIDNAEVESLQALRRCLDQVDRDFKKRYPKWWEAFAHPAWPDVRNAVENTLSVLSRFGEASLVPDVAPDAVARNAADEKKTDDPEEEGAPGRARPGAGWLRRLRGKS